MSEVNFRITIDPLTYLLKSEDISQDIDENTRKYLESFIEDTNCTSAALRQIMLFKSECMDTCCFVSIFTIICSCSAGLYFLQKKMNGIYYKSIFDQFMTTCGNEATREIASYASSITYNTLTENKVIQQFFDVKIRNPVLAMHGMNKVLLNEMALTSRKGKALVPIIQVNPYPLYFTADGVPMQNGYIINNQLGVNQAQFIPINNNYNNNQVLSVSQNQMIHMNNLMIVGPAPNNNQYDIIKIESNDSPDKAKNV